MINDLLNIDPAAESQRITSFIKAVLQKQGFENVVIGLSGGIDSATSLSLLAKSISPKNIFVAHLHYFESQIGSMKKMLLNAKIPKENIYEISINPIVKAFQQTLFPSRHSGKLSRAKRIQNHDVDSGVGRSVDLPRMTQKVRLGNIMARVRMIILYDLAKKHNALVCGTENKSEMYLGYFTRFGDEASDFEPIQHLYKTQIYALAKYLDIPRKIIDLPPTAGLWTGQTDEGDFGFSYKEADNVLYLYFEKKNSLSEIIKRGFPNTEKIIKWAKRNSFKHRLPYTIPYRL